MLLQRRTASAGQDSKSVVPQSNKKDCVVETADIGGLTLMFQDRTTELKWQQNQMKRNFGISQRFLFFSAIFQGLFFWSDILEQNESGNRSHALELCCMRILLGGLSLICCFLVSTGLLLPTQMMVFWINICYGIPTLLIFFLSRQHMSHWDSLYIVYGLSFMMLPKISPLNFFFAFGGAVVLTVLFIYVSAFRLGLQQWLLSNTILLVITLLFCYVSYSSEKSSRERWVLRERLKRENINLSLVASSIHDDLKKTATNERPFPLEEIQRETYAQTVRPFQLGVHMHQHYAPSSSGSYSYSPTSSLEPLEDTIDSDKKKTSQSLNQFFKGLAAWGMLLVMGNAFDFAYRPITANHQEVDSSASSALLMHSMGFSVFLLYFTGQMRWLFLNGLVGLIMLWIFSKSGLENKWVLVSTHSVGYILLATVVVIMILVFGGVVLVWSHLIDFVKDVLTRYPQVKDDLKQKRVLEQVLIRYISNMPRTEILSSSVADLEVGEERPAENEDKERSRAHARAGRGKTEMLKKSQDVCEAPNSDDRRKEDFNHNAQVLVSRRPNYCFFCLKSAPEFLIPACAAWAAKQLTEIDGQEAKGFPMCTPYTNLALARDELLVLCRENKEEISKLQSVLLDTEGKYQRKDVALSELKTKFSKLEAQYNESTRVLEYKLANEKSLKESEVQSIISQHNAQLTELKRVHRSLHTRQVQAMQQILSQLKAHQMLSDEANQDSKVASDGSFGVQDGSKPANKKSSSSDCYDKQKQPKEHTKSSSSSKESKNSKTAVGGTGITVVASSHKDGSVKGISQQSFGSVDSFISEAYSENSTISFDDLNRLVYAY